MRIPKIWFCKIGCLVGLGLACSVLLMEPVSCGGAADDWGGYDDEGYADNEEYSGRQDRGRGTGSYDVEVVYRYPEDDPAARRRERPRPEEDYVSTDKPVNTDPAREYEWVYSLSYEDIILSPAGTHVLYMVPKPGPGLGFEEPGRTLVVQQLPDGPPVCIPQIQDIARINFSPDGLQAYLLETTGKKLMVLDLVTYSIVEIFTLNLPFSVVDISPDGNFAVLTNLPTTDTAETDFSDVLGCTPPQSSGAPPGASLCKAGFINLKTGKHWVETFGKPLRDLDFCPFTADSIFTYSFQYDGPTSPNKSHVLFYAMAEQKFTNKIVFPNCADELVIAPLANKALLGPVTCQVWQQEPLEFEEPPQGEYVWEEDDGNWEWVESEGEWVNDDPISVLDLETRTFVQNMPGFGPVAVSQKHAMTVGFTNQEALENDWNYYGQKTPFGLIFVGLENLNWVVIDWGETVPAYTISPGGDYLFAYDDKLEDGVYGESTLKRIDLQTLEMLKMSGAKVELDVYAWHPGTSTMYLLYNQGLYYIPEHETAVVHVEVPLWPDLMTIRPQGDYLLLGDQKEPRFHTIPLSNMGPSGEPGNEFNLSL